MVFSSAACSKPCLRRLRSVYTNTSKLVCTFSYGGTVWGGQARQALRKTKGFWDEVLLLWQAGELPDDFFGVWDDNAKKMENRMWLFRANNHRELVEPFEIAAFYRHKLAKVYKRGKTFPEIKKLWQESEERQGKTTFKSSLVWCHDLARDGVPGNDPNKVVKFPEPPLVAPATSFFNSKVSLTARYKRGSGHEVQRAKRLVGSFDTAITGNISSSYAAWCEHGLENVNVLGKRCAATPRDDKGRQGMARGMTSTSACLIFL